MKTELNYTQNTQVFLQPTNHFQQAKGLKINFNSYFPVYEH